MDTKTNNKLNPMDALLEQLTEMSGLRSGMLSSLLDMRVDARKKAERLAKAEASLENITQLAETVLKESYSMSFVEPHTGQSRHIENLRAMLRAIGIEAKNFEDNPVRVDIKVDVTDALKNMEIFRNRMEEVFGVSPLVEYTKSKTKDSGYFTYPVTNTYACSDCKDPVEVASVKCPKCTLSGSPATAAPVVPEYGEERSPFMPLADILHKIPAPRINFHTSPYVPYGFGVMIAGDQVAVIRFEKAETELERQARIEKTVRDVLDAQKTKEHSKRP